VKKQGINKYCQLSVRAAISAWAFLCSVQSPVPTHQSPEAHTGLKHMLKTSTAGLGPSDCTQHIRDSSQCDPRSKHGLFSSVRDLLQKFTSKPKRLCTKNRITLWQHNDNAQYTSPCKRWSPYGHKLQVNSAGKPMKVTTVQYTKETLNQYLWNISLSHLCHKWPICIILQWPTGLSHVTFFPIRSNKYNLQYSPLSCCHLVWK